MRLRLKLCLRYRRPDGGLATGVKAELVPDLLDVMLGGALGDEEFLGDLAIRQALRQEGRHLAFATSKLRSCGLHCGAGVAPAGPDSPRTSFPPCAAARAFSPATKMVCLTAGRPFARLDDSRSVKPSNRSNVCKTFIAGSIPAVASV